MARVRVYIDGLNLYHDLVRRLDGRGKWLDIESFADTLAGEGAAERVFYFTSRVATVRGDTEPKARQRGYLLAVEAMPRVEVQYGLMRVQKVKRWLVRPRLWVRRFPRVENPVEKGVGRRACDSIAR